jgi:YrbI family 3-deoxy-D-manno-octulosonate 8-phosphate phosphatase
MQERTIKRMKKARLQSGRRILPARIRTQVLKRLRLLAVDVDGVLTDGGMYYGESGEEMKKFNTRDGMGLKLLQAEGFITAFITRENTKLVARRGEKLGIPEIHQGVHDKLGMLQKLVTQYHLELHQAAYMGDDVNDLEVLRAVGFSGAPADCMEPVKQVVHYICRLKGGEGAVREVVDMILTARGAQPLFK